MTTIEFEINFRGRRALAIGTFAGDTFNPGRIRFIDEYREINDVSIDEWKEVTEEFHELFDDDKRDRFSIDR